MTQSEVLTISLKIFISPKKFIKKLTFTNLSSQIYITIFDESTLFWYNRRYKKQKQE